MVATSVAEPGASAVAELIVTERVVSVAVSPANVTVPAGGSAQFTATVTTTCGAFAIQRTLAARPDGVLTER